VQKEFRIIVNNMATNIFENSCNKCLRIL